MSLCAHNRGRALGRATLLALALAACAAAQEGDSDSQSSDGGGSANALEKAYQALTAEARVLDDYEKKEKGEKKELEPKFRRPHPALKGVGPERAPAVLERMVGDFTGNKFRDTYIRWHLMWVIRRTHLGQLKDETDHLVTLVRRMPKGLDVSLKKVREHVPRDLWKKYWKLRRKTRVTTGFPPFQETHWGKSALQYLSGAALKEAKAALKKMQKIKPKLEVKVDKAARRFNNRVRRVNYILRRYRGELIYELLRTGNPRMLEMVSKTIAKRVDRSDIVAFDLLAYFYQAAFDGVLARGYSQSDFRQSAAILNRAAGKSDAYKKYKVGPVRFNATHHSRRNFADYAFHIVKLLRNPELMNLFPAARKERQ